MPRRRSALLAHAPRLRPGTQASCWRRGGASFATEISEVPSTTHPLGLRAGGEGGTTPALGAVANAVADALAAFGVRHVEMPLTPERVWRAIREAAARAR